MSETKVTLEPTAAMALLLGQGIYQNNVHVAEYLQKIDLSSGLALAERLKSMNRHAVEAMVNRKYFHLDHTLKHLASQQHPVQVIIMGGGYDPISVHLLDVAADKMVSIIEIDASGFGSKKELFHEINVPHLEKIKFVQANVITTNTLEVIQQYGYVSHQPTLITMEGMVYYLSEEQFGELIQSFRSPNKTTTFCIDYVLPWTEAPTEAEQIEVRNGTAAIEKQAGMKLTYYTTAKIVELVERLGGTAVNVSNQKEVEWARTGRNSCFHQKGQGGFEFITFNI